MDPHACLEEMLELAERLYTTPGDEHDPHDVDRLAELVVSLDHWIRSGGFLPDPWARASFAGGRR
jgi:hypothetical protein